MPRRNRPVYRPYLQACQPAENRHPDTDDLGRFQQSSGFGNRNRTPLQPGLIPDEINDAAGLRDLYRDLELHLRQ